MIEEGEGEHVFDDKAAFFTATVRTRLCLKCVRIEVMLASTGEWLTIGEYLQRHVAGRRAD